MIAAFKKCYFCYVGVINDFIKFKPSPKPIIKKTTMCIVSDKIIFCTCNGNYEELQHYWVLYRRTGRKNVIVVGEPMMPTSMRDLNFEQNNNTLLARLNEPEAFDLPMNFKEKDRLDMVINNKATEIDLRFSYSFESRNGKWNFIESDPFDIENHFNEEMGGKMKSVLNRKK